MNTLKINTINSHISNNLKEFIAASEEKYRKQVVSAADRVISECQTKPAVLISGPSGSAKTTTAEFLEKELCRKGYSTRVISMDNYFIPCNGIHSKNMPIDENGEIDLESPHRLNIPLFQEHMEKMLNCEAVDIPVFSFASQCYEKFIPYQRKPEEIIIFEGIHALNPLVTGELSNSAVKLYVSVRTRIEDSEGKLMHPSKIRLLRRLCRDKIYRGREVSEIFDMYPSVSKGEELYIMPFKGKADIEIDTFLDYEASVYKSFIYNELKNEKLSSYALCREICDFIDELSPLDVNILGENISIKEFII